MNNDLLKSVIFDQHEIIKNSTIVPRRYSFEPNANHVLVGLRRAGKSTLLYSMVQNLVASGIDWNQIIYINFEDERLSEFSINDFNDIISVQTQLSPEKGYFFLDEMQNINGWEKFARRMADSKQYIQITGSNAKMLSSEIESTLGGRFISSVIYPFDFLEFLRANNIAANEKAILQTGFQGVIRRFFEQYLEYGGFPETLCFSDKRQYVSSIYQKVLLGDIIMRNQIRNPNGIKLLMKKLAESVKDYVSFSKLHGLLNSIGVNISKDTIIDYVRYAQEAYLIFGVHNFFAKFADRESTPKYYFSDNGLLNLFLFDRKPLLLENLVAISLMHQHPRCVYYLKSERNSIDIDFYVPDTHTAIQVTYSLNNTSSDREIKNLLLLAKSMPEVRNYLILTNEDDKILDIEGIHIIVKPVFKWLIENE